MSSSPWTRVDVKRSDRGKQKYTLMFCTEGKIEERGGKDEKNRSIEKGTERKEGYGERLETTDKKKFSER